MSLFINYFAECRYAECHNAECRYAEYRGASGLAHKSILGWKWLTRQNTLAYYTEEKSFIALAKQGIDVMTNTVKITNDVESFKRGQINIFRTSQIWEMLA